MDNYNTTTVDYNEICHNFKYPPVHRINHLDIFEQYDSTIGCRTKFGRLDANLAKNRTQSYAIINIPEANQQVIITYGNSFDECYINILNNNFKPLCLVNCLNYGTPDTCIYELKSFLEKLNSKCIKYDVPVIGGNVSLYNTTNNVNIKPTPQIVMIGILNDKNQA